MHGEKNKRDLQVVVVAKYFQISLADLSLTWLSAGCNTKFKYTLHSKVLLGVAFRRPAVFSCSWGFFFAFVGILRIKHCHLRSLLSTTGRKSFFRGQMTVCQQLWVDRRKKFFLVRAV